MIQIDSREHQKVIDGIKKAVDQAGEKWFVSKLYVGDYMNCDHGKGIEKLDDVLWWENPRAKKRVKKNGVWIEQEQKVMHGDTLYKILCTMQRKYGVEFLFCDKKNTGKRIMEILSDGQRNN